MAELARQCTTASLPNLTYLQPGDVVWQTYNRNDFENVHLWHDGSGLAGYVDFEPPVNAVVQVRPDVGAGSELFAEMLAWAETRRRALADGSPTPIAYAPLGSDTLSTTALASDSERVRALLALGFERVEQHAIRYRRSLEAELEVPQLVAGVVVRHATDRDIEERLDLHRDAWSVWGPSPATVEGYRRLRGAPLYDETLDIVLESDGRLLSYCICWADPATGVGVFEPVGTRPTCAGRGFGRAVLLEGMRRLKERGLHTALIGTSSVNARAAALYPHAGFSFVEKEHYYVKRLS